jgi:hypothetical protein
MNNSMIGNLSRDTLTTALRAITQDLDTLANGAAIQRHKVAADEIRALLKSQEEMAACAKSQVDAQPVYMVRTHGSSCWEEVSGESLELCQADPAEYEVRKLYTYAEASEVERLRAELGQATGEYDRAVNRVSAARDESESLRAQLALPAGIGRLINTQDNRGTDQPLFAVMEKREFVTLDTHDHDRIVWVETQSGDYNKASPSYAKTLEQKYQSSEDYPSHWERYAMKDIDVFVTACFTEQGCIDFLARDGHNHTKPFIYAFGSFRNAEYQSLRNWLKALPASIQKPDGHKCPNCDAGNLKENNYAWHCDSCEFVAPEQDGELDE